MAGETPQYQGKKEKDGEVVVSRTPVGGEGKEGQTQTDRQFAITAPEYPAQGRHGILRAQVPVRVVPPTCTCAKHSNAHDKAHCLSKFAHVQN